MKLFMLICAALMAAVAPALAASGNCIDADPTSILARVTGDFELSIDPQDPAQNVIFLSNISKQATTPQRVIIAQLDGQTGIVMPDSLTTIATNFLGSSQMNGPSWVYTPSAQLGILFVGTGGVHAIYRSSQPAAWNDFLFNYNGSVASQVPIILPNTSSGAYPGNPPDPPTEAATYPQYMGTCKSLCYAAYNSGIPTDVAPALVPYGYTATTSIQGIKDGSLLISACATSTSCGLFQAKIDNAGGFSSFKQIAATGSDASVSLAVAQHPVTGTTVIFADGAGSTINVWQQTTTNGPLSLIGAVVVPVGAEHFRAGSSNTQVVLNYFIRSGGSIGSYTIPVSAVGSTLTVGASKKVSLIADGSELDWFPAAAQWVIFYRKSTLQGVKQYTRCFVTP